MPKPSPRSSGELGELQRSIAGALMRPMAAGERLSRASDSVAQRFIKPNDRLTARERLEIYNQQYWWRLLASFRDDFRGLRVVIGERKFERLAVAYLSEHGSTSWSLRDLGCGVEDFVRRHPELVSPHELLALDMIRVEWARVIAFDGPDKPPVDPARLQRLAPERLRFSLQPYLTLITLAHPVDTLLGRLRLRDSETSSASNAVSADRRRRPIRLTARPSVEPIHLAVHRVDFLVYYKRLEPGAYRVLSALGAGTVLAEACEAAFADSSEIPPDAAAQIQQWFADWMRFGWLCAR